MSRRFVIASSLAAISVLALAGCASGSAEPAASTELGSESDPVTLGVVGASDPYWETYEAAVEDAGIQLEIVDFTEYSQPNPALSAGDLDINQFQHIQYLADYNVSSGDDLQPIGATAIYPLGLYSDKYTSVDEIPEGETIVVPNDNVNQARGLLVLQSAGLITLEDGGNASSTVRNVIEEESKVKVDSVEPSLTSRSLPDVAGAIINNDFLEPAGIDPDSVLVQDDPNDASALPYVNIFVTRAADADNEVLNQLAEIYHDTQAVLDQVQEQSGGTAVFTDTPKAELQASLAETEEAIRNAE